MQTSEAHCENRIVLFACVPAVVQRVSARITSFFLIQECKRFFKSHNPFGNIHSRIIVLLVTTVLLLHPVIVGSALNNPPLLFQIDLHQDLSAHQKKIYRFPIINQNVADPLPDTKNMAVAEDSLPDELLNQSKIQIVETLKEPPVLNPFKPNDALDQQDDSDNTADYSNQAEEEEIEENEDALPPYHHIILEVAARYHIDPALIQAVIMVESSNNPNAVSRCGAKGLMQLMPETAREVGVEDLFNPEHNIEGGTKYLHRMLRRFNGDIKLALAAYNAGSRHVLRYGGVPPFKETQQYVKKVLAHYEAYQMANM